MPKDTFLNLPEEKRNAITQAAIREFEYHSYDQASVNRIVEEAGIPKGSMYQYFSHKKDLYKYILSLIVEAKMQYLTPVMTNPFAHPIEVVLRDMFASGLRFAKEHPHYMRIGNKFIQDKTHPIYLEVMADNQNRAEQVYEMLLAQAVQRGELRKDLDIHFTAHLIFSLSNNLVEYNPDPHQDRWLDTMYESLEKLLDVLFLGIRNPYGKAENNASNTKA